MLSLLAVIIPTSRSLYQFTRPSSAVKRKVLVGRSVDICSSHPATRRVVQQRFALLWGPGAYDIYNAKMQKIRRAAAVSVSIVLSRKVDFALWCWLALLI